MATLTKCDRCETIDVPTQQVIAAGVGVDLCDVCFGELFGGDWFTAVQATLNAVPRIPQRGPRAPGRGQRPPIHGFTATAIEASQDPTVEIAAAQDS